MSGRSTRACTTVCDSSAVASGGAVAVDELVMFSVAESGRQSAVQVTFAPSVFSSGTAFGNGLASKIPMSAAVAGSFSGPDVRGANAGLPVTEPLKTMLTQSRSVAT